MANKILGLDVGVSSVGWGIIDEDDKIIASGVRLFEELDVSGNESRRNFRGTRRLKSRRKLRIADMKSLLKEHGYYLGEDYTIINPYEARLKGLTQQLSKDELVAALMHLSKRRGSSLEIAGEESSVGVSSKAVLARHAKQLKGKFIVEIQLEKCKNQGEIRDNENIFKTEDYLKEAAQILKNQKTTVEFNNKVLNIIKRRRHFSEGPGSINTPTPYGRWRYLDHDLTTQIINSFNEDQKNLYKKASFIISYENVDYKVLKSGKIINEKPLNLIDLMRGKCSVYQDELRAPKNSLSALIHNLLNDLNNIKIICEENRGFSETEKQKALNVVINEGVFKPNNINGLLKLFDLKIEDVIGYRVDSKDKPEITDFKIYRDLLTIFKNNNEVLTNEIADEISEILTKTQIVVERIEELSKTINNQTVIKEVAELSKYNGYHAFSFKALKLLNKEMMVTNKNQQEILTSSIKRDEKQLTKLEFDDTLILSPVAKRAHREALKLIDELIREFGNFSRIVIETTREKNNQEIRKRIRDFQKQAEDKKNNALSFIEDAGFSGDDAYSGTTILKIRLYDEQLGKCAYTGKAINLTQLITNPKAYEIDHIIPRSISQDNSYNNKVLVISEVNQLKGNSTPFGYFSSGKAKPNYIINNYNAFKENILNNPNYQKNSRKRNNLLFEEDITKFSVLKQFTNRNLVDTSYAARSLMTTLKNYFSFNSINTSVFTIRGKQTDLFRSIGKSIWLNEYKYLDIELNPFNKDRDKYMHHAIDALIIAGLSNQRTLKYLFCLNQYDKEEYLFSKETGELLSLDPINDEQLIKFIRKIGKIKEDEVRFSWKIDRKINRSFSDQTIYSTRIKDNEEYVVKKYSNIYEIDKNKLEKLILDDKEKLLVYQHDRQTYNIIKDAFLQYQHEKLPLKAYMDIHGKIRKNGKGPYVTNLKYLANKLGNHIDITKGKSKDKKIVLLQISPYRIDIYKNNKNQYKFITIRYADFKKDNKGFYLDKDEYKDKLKAKKIDNKFEFVYSFNRNEVIELTNDSNEVNKYRFIVANNDITNVIEVKSIEKRDLKPQVMLTIGTKITLIKKYAVSPAGRESFVNQEELTLVR